MRVGFGLRRHVLLLGLGEANMLWYWGVEIGSSLMMVPPFASWSAISFLLFQYVFDL
jgi:hypothetical protein